MDSPYQSDVRSLAERAAEADGVAVDIVMGTYNGAAFLQEQIHSLLAQTHTHWRLLVRDDGSSDNTDDLLRAATESDSRIRLVSDGLGNLGFSRNFLHLLSLTTAPYVMFCDQDDVWLPRKIELTLKEMVRVEARHSCRPTLVHCDSIVADTDLIVLRDRFVGAKGRRRGLSGMLFANCVQGATSMINASLRESVLCMEPVLPYDFHCGLIASAIGQRQYIDQALMLYRQHSRNTIGAGMNGESSRRGKVSETLQLAINAASPVIETVRSFGKEISPQTAKEMDDFVELLSGGNRLRRLFIALRRRYAFYRRRDQLNLLLYICGIQNV